MKRLTPYEMPKFSEARRAVCEHYWRELEKRVKSQRLRDELEPYVEASKKFK